MYITGLLTASVYIGAGGSLISIVKMTTDGTLVWMKSAGGVDGSSNGIAILASALDGNVYVMGDSTATGWGTTPITKTSGVLLSLS